MQDALEKTPKDIANQIAGIVGSTRHVHTAWAALTAEERQQMISEWTASIRRDPGCAKAQIMDSILSRPELGTAWRKLGGSTDNSDGVVHLDSIKHLVSLFAHEETTA